MLHPLSEPALSEANRVFIPPSFQVDDVAILYDFIDRYSFATLVSTLHGSPFATHLPLLLDRENDVLLGHIARANPHREAFTREQDTLAIFAGPHAYISPSWYVTAPSVPTWNYTAVHVYGTSRILSAERTREVVDRTILKYESTREAPWSNDLPEDYRQKLLAGIVGFEMPIMRIEGKFKLGQNRSEPDQASMRAALHTGNTDARQLAEFIVDWDKS